MVTGLLFTLVVLLVGLSVARDVARSKRNTTILMEIGARVFGSHQTSLFLVLVVLWTVSCIAEVTLLGRSLGLAAGVLGITLALLGWYVSRKARGALGQRWTLDVVSLPGSPLVTGQIYDRMRHPEYSGLFLIFLGIPLAHSAWLTLLSTFILGLGLLVTRVKLEESVLNNEARYLMLLGDRPRFIPRKSRHNGRIPPAPTWLHTVRKGDIPAS